MSNRKIDAFMETVFFNLKTFGIDAYAQRGFTIVMLERAIKDYFGIKTKRSVKEYVKKLRELGYIEPAGLNWQFSDLAIRRFWK